MAFISNNNRSNSAEFEKADAWLNVSVTDKNGRQHRLGKIGIGLYQSRAVDAAFMKKMKEDPDFLATLEVSFTESHANEEIEF